MKSRGFVFWIRPTLGLFLLSALVTVAAQAMQQEKILFASSREGEMQLRIYTMNSDGSEQVKLTENGVMELDPARSPDGRRIACTVLAQPDVPQGDIYLMNADGTERQRLTGGEPGTIAMGPAWSPDGRRIVFTVLQAARGEEPRMSLHVIDVDGENEQSLGEGKLLPAWSPDGQRLLYTVMRGEGMDQTIQLHVMDADGTAGKLLTSEDVKAGMGAWSPDGQRIAYISGDQLPDLYVMNKDGSESTRLTDTDDQMEFGPQWSADGRRIFFTGLPGMAPGPNGTEIYVVNADGTNVRQLTDNDAADITTGAGLFLIMERIERQTPAAVVE